MMCMEKETTKKERKSVRERESERERKRKRETYRWPSDQGLLAVNFKRRRRDYLPKDFGRSGTYTTCHWGYSLLAKAATSLPQPFVLIHCFTQVITDTQRYTLRQT